MHKTSDFSVYGSYVDEESDLAQYDDDYYSAPQFPTVSGCNLTDFAYNSVPYVTPNSEVFYPVMSVVHGGTTYFQYPEVVYVPVFVYYYVPVTFASEDPVGYVNPCPVNPNLNGAAEMRYEYACDDPPEDNGIYDSGDCGPEEKVSPAISSYFSYAENPEKLLDAPVINDSENASSQVKKTFVNRGVVADPAAYKHFCDSVEDKIKKLSVSSPDKKTTTDRDAVKSSYRKFYSTEEERRTILNSSSARQKTYVDRGVVTDPSSYRKFCQCVEDGIKKKGSPENSQLFGRLEDLTAKQGSNVAHKERVVYEETSQTFMDRILKSAEYIHVQDNLKNPKHYSDLLYRQVLKKQNKSSLMEILPSIIEESFTLDDVTAVKSCGELRLTEPLELDSNDECKPIITKRPKNRLKCFRKWLAKTFCCCCSTNKPP